MKKLFNLLILLCAFSIYAQNNETISSEHRGAVLWKDGSNDCTDPEIYELPDRFVIYANYCLGTMRLWNTIAWRDFGTLSTGLEALDEGNGIGWKLIGREPLNYGNIGLNAVDFSTSTVTSSVNGATGDYSFSVGVNNIASGSISFAGGISNNVSGNGSTAFGSTNTITGENAFSVGVNNLTSGSGVTLGHYNFARVQGEVSIGVYGTDYIPVSVNGFNSADRIFNVGNGSASNNLSNAFTILKSGYASFPSLTNALIDAGGSNSAVTSGWVQDYVAANSSSVSIPINQISYGTGTGLTSSIDFTFNNTTKTLNLNGDGTANDSAFLTINSSEVFEFRDGDGSTRTTNDIYANSYITNGGLSTQFLKADGTLDNNTYLTDAPSNGTTYGRNNGNWVATSSGTDDQTALEVNYDNTDSSLTATNVKAALDELDNKIPSNQLPYVTVTDSVYTMLEADILASKTYLINAYRADGITPVDTVTVTYPTITHDNSLLVPSFANISGSSIKVIPDTNVVDYRSGTKKQYTTKNDLQGYVSISSIAQDSIWGSSNDWTISDYTPTVPFDSGLILNGTLDDATNIDITGTSDWAITGGEAVLTVPTSLSSDSFGDNDIRFVLSETPLDGVNYELTFDISSADNENRIGVEVQGSTNYSYPWGFQTLANGTHTVVIQFTDDGGGISNYVGIQASTTNPDNITIDNVSLKLQ